MRRLTVLLLALLVCTAGACKRREREKARVETIEETTPSLASTINMGDPRSSAQLIKGFHGIEQNAWRWTMGHFSVTLRPPLSAPQKGATLVVKFAIPGTVLEQVKSMTLSANVNGTPIAGETYTKPGEQIYSKEVPASALGADAVTVEFALHKFLPPGPADQRELGFVVSSIGLESK